MLFRHPARTKYNIQENLIIKKPLPNVGIVCSNPRRAERIVESHLNNVNHLKEYNTAWPLDIYIGKYTNKHVFVASIPVGAAGAAFAIQQLATAGAQYIIRYGSNDDPHLTKERMREVIIVDLADNLVGLMQSSGAPAETWGAIIKSSDILIEKLQAQSKLLNRQTQLAICHHIEDYGAYAFPHSAGSFGENVLKQIQILESRYPDRLHCRDMETAALFYRAAIDGFHAATVLQNVPKFRGTHQTYEGEQGLIAKQMEPVFCKLILNTLVEFARDYIPDADLSSHTKQLLTAKL